MTLAWRSGILLLSACATAASLAAGQLPSPVRQNRDGSLEYTVEKNGDRVPDFSHAGYGGGGVALPAVPGKMAVEPVIGDDTQRIQKAIDYVCRLPLDANGFRGAVVLGPGRFEVSGRLRIPASGVVLRGSGDGEDGTVLVAQGYDRRALIEIVGNDRPRVIGEAHVADDHVPVGATRIRLQGNPAWQPGTTLAIERESTAAWIESVGMHEAPGRQPYQWRPSKVNVRWDRDVKSIDGDALILDAPLTTALDAKISPAKVTAYVQEGYLSRCGIENLRCESEYDRSNPLDEYHAWNAIDLHGIRDGWVANVTAVHFAGSAVQVGAKAQRITVQDCRSLAPVSEVAGYRRLAFHSRGQQVLFLRCHSEDGRNDFTTGYLSAGPVVFLDCEATRAHSFSGSIGSWSSGVLFDSVSIDGGALRLDNLETFNQGVGWAAANSMIWGSSAAEIVCRAPPGAQNWAVAVWGQFVGNGRWSMVNEFAQPRSLYRAQLVARLGSGAERALAPRAYAAAIGVPDISSILIELNVVSFPDEVLQLDNGMLKLLGKRLSGKQAEVTWWRGRLEPSRASEVGPALTRFSPGRTGTGLTDEIPAIAERMKARGEVVLRHHYGLWYDRRRDDHQMIRRANAEVWPPFFEQPFARSGQGKAWDGLSRYDLTKYNPWYFGRLREFAAEARRRGLVLVNEMYFQHNILESAGHWVDSPWRTTNNINDTGFTEPPPLTGDTIRMAPEFYDVSHSVRRELHRAYIRQCLANLADEPNVIHTLTAENSGPLHFMQFWLDVIAEWKRETGKRPLIALSAPKDVQDAILADTGRAAVVDVIDLTYWFRTPDGAEYAPLGGTKLAPRQHLRLWKGGRPTAESIATMAREYRERFPAKAVITGLEQAGDVQP